MAQATVNNFSELKSAIEDATTTEITLSGDVTFSGGIKIPVSKSVLTIDCGGHTVTDNNSTAYTDAIYVPSGAGKMTVTVKNATWNGRNYYGIICVYDSAANADVTTVIDGVNYTGPQMIYNRYGTTVVRDCSVAIEKNGASASAQEFGEVNRLILQGKVTVNSSSVSTAVVWFPFAGSAFTVSENASVEINAPGTYAFYTDGAAKPAFLFEKNSSARFSTKNGMFYSSGSGAHIASSLTLNSGALLYVTASANNGVPLFKCSGNVEIGQGASLFLIMPTAGNSALLYLSSAATVAFSAPKNVLLYSASGKVFAFDGSSASSPGTVTISASLINYWAKAKTPFSSAGGFDDAATTALYKANGDNAEITQKLTSSAVISTASNIEEGDGGYPVSGENFNLSKAAVLSAGSLAVSVNKITDLTEVVTGSTDPDSDISYSDSVQSATGKADKNGNFSLVLTKKPVVGDKATIKSNKNFLTAKTEAEISGSVSISSLPDIPFNAFASPKRSAKVKRINPDWFLTLTDTRPNGGKWSLYLSLGTPLRSGENVIENAVIFTGGTQSAVIGTEKILVFEWTSEKAGVINVSWAPDEGVLLSLEKDAEYEKGNYSSTLVWSVDFE